MKRALIISCFDWYKARLELVREELINRGYEVTVIVSDFNHIRKEYIRERFKECTYVHVPAYKSNISIERVVSHLSFGKNIKNRIERIKPDLIWLLLPPNNTAKYCKEYKRQHPRSKLILDIIDMWPESMPLRYLKKTPPAKMWQRWRNDCIRVADHVFTECNLYRKRLRYVMDNEKSSTLYLFKEQTEEERTLVRRIINSRIVNSKTVKFAYLGSMNNIIDIGGICKVISQYKEKGYNCELHAIGDGVSRQKFEDLVKKTGCKTFFYGVIFNEIEKIKILTSCDFAFNMMKSDVAVGLTIKSIDYLSYGLPLINNIKGDTWRIVENNDLGYNITEGVILHRGSFNHEAIVLYYEKMFTEQAFLCRIEKVFGEKINV